MKREAPKNGNFEEMLQKLIREGIYNKPQQGEITLFHRERGYGFISCNGTTYFIHIKAIVGRQYPVYGDKFLIEVGADNRVRKAIKV